MTDSRTSKEEVCEHDFVCIECGSGLDDLQQPLGWMTEGGQMFIEHRLKLERPEDFVRFTIPVPRVPVAANEEDASSHEPPAAPRQTDLVEAFEEWSGSAFGATDMDLDAFSAGWNARAAQPPGDEPASLVQALEVLRQRWSHNVSFEATIGACKEEIELCIARAAATKESAP